MSCTAPDGSWPVITPLVHNRKSTEISDRNGYTLPIVPTRVSPCFTFTFFKRHDQLTSPVSHGNRKNTIKLSTSLLMARIREKYPRNRLTCCLILAIDQTSEAIIPSAMPSTL